MNIGSVHAHATVPRHSVYAASKGGIEALTRSTALELAPQRITVNAVAPGFIEVARTIEQTQDYSRESVGATIPLGRVGTPEDVTALIAFLCGPSAGFITGQVYTVDGGLVCRLLSAVFTEDIYHNLIRRNASEPSLMVVARLSTFLFGAAMIGVALMVPHIGGLVEMILSIAAITGRATLLPPIWALLSKRISSSAAIWASVLALAVSLFFKLASPALFGVRLSRAMEMTVGVGVPTAVLLVFELVLWMRRETSPGVARFEVHKRGLKAATASSLQSRFGARVVAYSTVYIGACLFLLGWFATHARLLVTGIAAGVIAGGALALWLTSRERAVEPDLKGGVAVRGR